MPHPDGTPGLGTSNPDPCEAAETQRSATGQVRATQSTRRERAEKKKDGHHERDGATPSSDLPREMGHYAPHPPTAPHGWPQEKRRRVTSALAKLLLWKASKNRAAMVTIATNTLPANDTAPPVPEVASRPRTKR